MEQEKIKIAFCNRPSYDNPLGGDAVQMLQTKKYLEENYNVDVEIITSPEMITLGYSIVHVFNFLTYRITAPFIERAQSLGIPIVSSCIYWDYSYAGTFIFYELLRHYPDYIAKRQVQILRNLLQFIGKISLKPTGTSFIFRRYVRKFIQASTVIAPNSLEERDLLLSFSGMNDNRVKEKFQIVYNGVQLNKKSVMDEDDFFRKYKLPHEYILQVGRIEYLKNQLNLLYALKDKPEIPIVFVGQVFSQRYFNKLNKLSQERGNVFFIDRVEHSDISSFYKYAALHVLLSLRESPGLVNLEAASLSCPIVVSDKRFIPLNTYFKDVPYVVDPFDIAQIKSTILKAYTERKTTFIDMEEFSWRNVAKQNYQIYEKILKR